MNAPKKDHQMIVVVISNKIYVRIKDVESDIDNIVIQEMVNSSVSMYVRREVDAYIDTMSNQN